MRKPKILVVGSFVMDLIVGTERFPQEGETVIGTDFSMASGGKGANQAVQAARLSAEVTMVGKVGKDDFGTRMLESVSAAGVDVSKVARSENKPSAIGNVQLERRGNQTVNRICVVSGANMDITAADIAFLENEIGNYDMVILQLEIPMEINIAVAKYASAKNVPVMLNSAPYSKLPEELLPLITYISPNEHEASEMTGIKITDLETAKAAADRIMETGIKKVIITLGKLGAVFADSDNFIFSPAVDGVNAVDPTAAGDSFVGAFCTAACYGLAPKEAMEFANYTASVTVSKMGAQPSLPTLCEVGEIINSQNGALENYKPMF